MNQAKERVAPRTAGRRWTIADRRKLELEFLHKVEFAGAVWQDRRRDLAAARELAAAALTHDKALIHDRCRQLHDAMQLALDQYRSALQRFNRLVLDGELPE